MLLKSKATAQYAMTSLFALALITVIFYSLFSMLKDLSALDAKESSEHFKHSIVPSLKLSLFYSLVASLLSTFGGFLVVYVLRKVPRIFIFISSVPHLAFAHLIWLSYSSGGVWSKVSFKLFDERLTFLSGTSGWGIILGFVLKELPFAVLVLAPLFKRELTFLEESAVSLGANKFQVITKVIVPSLKAPIIGTMLILFTYTFGAFEIPYILSPDQIKPLSVTAFEAFNSIELSDRYITYMISLIIFTINFFVYVLFSRVFVTDDQRLSA